ncbi:hypothetical protein HOY82DRAFT_617263 [Tuber indicum]|nr:hypothetical protein HOY82DRAFT_617263 [Tuber indicum]
MSESGHLGSGTGLGVDQSVPDSVTLLAPSSNTNRVAPAFNQPKVSFSRPRFGTIAHSIIDSGNQDSVGNPGTTSGIGDNHHHTPPLTIPRESLTVPTACDDEQLQSADNSGSVLSTTTGQVDTEQIDKPVSQESTGPPPAPKSTTRKRKRVSITSVEDTSHTAVEVEESANEEIQVVDSDKSDTSEDQNSSDCEMREVAISSPAGYSSSLLQERYASGYYKEIDHAPYCFPGKQSEQLKALKIHTPRMVEDLFNQFISPTNIFRAADLLVELSGTEAQDPDNPTLQDLKLLGDLGMEMPGTTMESMLAKMLFVARRAHDFIVHNRLEQEKLKLKFILAYLMLYLTLDFGVVPAMKKRDPLVRSVRITPYTSPPSVRPEAVRRIYKRGPLARPEKWNEVNPSTTQGVTRLQRCDIFGMGQVIDSGAYAKATTFQELILLTTKETIGANIVRLENSATGLMTLRIG